MQTSKPMTVRNTTSTLNKSGERKTRTRSKTPNKATGIKINHGLPLAVHASHDASAGHVQTMKASLEITSGSRGNNLVNKYLRTSGNSRFAGERMSPDKRLHDS